MVQKSRSKPARKAAKAKPKVTPARPKAARAKPKATPAKPRTATAKPKTGAKKAAPRKAASRKPAARKATGGATAQRKAAPKKAASAKASVRGAKTAKTKNIFRRKSAAARPRARQKATAATPDRDPIVLNAPLIDALDEALTAAAGTPAGADQPASAERGAGMSDYLAPGQGRPPARRPGSGEASPESADAPARTNKLVPTNAVHTTKRRMKRNTWQGPTFGLAAVAAVMAILVLGHDRQPPDVSPLEQRAGSPTLAPLAARTPPPVDPVQAAPDRAPQLPVQTARPAVPEWPSNATGPSGSQEPDPIQGLKVLELVEMERMLKHLDMDPSQPDGIVDHQTESAIRMYQQIAGLPVDGQPSPELLDDMREVVKMLDADN